MTTQALARIRFPARFRIVKELGRGGMGVVYEADDEQLCIRVALKTLSQATAQFLLRLKSEFRVLAGLSHPNLACLYELIEFEGRWLFTMELINGSPLPDWVRGTTVSAPSSEQTQTRTKTSLPGSGIWTGPARLHAPLADLASYERLRSGTVQLATAIEWLHGQGMLHRDIKGSNVLVTPEGRVVLLDFGLALQMSTKAPEGYAGTPAYMAPERFRNAPPAAAEDWYGLGALLFEAISGQHVCTGMRNLDTSVPDVRSLAPDAPQDLASLTNDLLEYEPELRPSGAAVLTRLVGDGEQRRQTRARPVFIRQEELTSVRSALSGAAEGRAVAAVVHGNSGMGKSSLADEFLSTLPSDSLVLRGRCIEQESVPYKAFDGIVDALADELRLMPRAHVAAVLPRDARTLAVLFPIFLEVAEFAEAPQRVHQGLTPFEVRQRGTHALRELLQRLGDRRKVVLYADDFQWADGDSRQLLANLLSPPSPPAVMLLLTCREEEGAHDALLTFLKGIKGDSTEVDVVGVGLEPLTDKRGEQLARDLLRALEMRVSPEKLQQMVQESGGNPYLLSELVACPTSDQDIGTSAISLDAFLSRSILSLPPVSRQLLELLSVCTGPTRLRDLCAAASLPGIDPAWTLPLRASRLMKGAVTDPGGSVTFWHDRVRETTVSHMGSRERELAHRAMAGVLERSPDADPETLAIHWHACSEREPACRYYSVAAERAAAALAFEHAAALLRNAYALCDGDIHERRKLRTRLADALANGGNPVESATLFLESASDTDGEESIDLRRRAAYQLCIGGHMAQGREEMLSLLRTQNVRLPVSESQAMRWLVCSHVRMVVRGYRFKRRNPEQIPAAELRLVDFTWSAATALYMVDMIYGAELLVRNALLSLRCGEPGRVARSLGWSASMLAVSGAPMESRVWRLVGLTEQIAAETGEPHALGMACLARGTSSFSLGYFSDTTQPLERAHSIFMEQCSGARWEAGIANTVLVWSLAMQGKYARVWPMVQQLHREARERNNLLEASNLASATYYSSLLILDRPEEALEVLANVRAEWKHERAALQTIMANTAEAITLRYMGQYEESSVRVRAVLQEAKLAGLLRSQWMRGGFMNHMALTAVCMLTEGRPGDHKNVALGFARKLENEKRAWGSGFAAQIRAGVLASEQRYEEALLEVLKARNFLQSCGLMMWADLLTYRAGQLMGGEEGREMRSHAEAAVCRELGANLQRLLAFFTPMRTSG